MSSDKEDSQQKQQKNFHYGRKKNALIKNVATFIFLLQTFF